MNTAQVKEKHFTRVEITMEGPVNARDAEDFLFQVKQIYRDKKGLEAQASIPDDAWTVAGDGDGGLVAWFETKRKTTRDA